MSEIRVLHKKWHRISYCLPADTNDYPTSPKTSPVQRGYSMLKIIFKKGGQFETRNYGDHGKYAFIGVLKSQ